MHFFRDCIVGSTTAPGVVLPPASMQSSVLTKFQEQILDSIMLARMAKYMDVFSKSSCMFIHSGSRLWLPASLYILHPCSRPRDFLVLMYRMYCMPILQEQKTATKNHYF